LKENKNSR